MSPVSRLKIKKRHKRYMLLNAERTTPVATRTTQSCCTSFGVKGVGLLVILLACSVVVWTAFLLDAARVLTDAYPGGVIIVKMAGSFLSGLLIQVLCRLALVA